jgi:CDP-diacylglycerol---serine O-phosphatidyltransferase
MKRVAVVPSLLTLANGLLGFLALAKCADAARLGAGSPLFGPTLEYASYCVLLAMLCDSLDGWVARRLGTASDLGAQLDSLCDAVTFGVVPGVLFKTFVEGITAPTTSTLPRYYLAAGACYALCAVLRLARFNVDNAIGREDHKAFRGLPSPGAAIVVVSTVLFYFDDRWEGLHWLKVNADGVRQSIVYLMPVAMFALGFLMVSRIGYPHFAAAILTRKLTVRRFAQLVVLIALAFLEPMGLLFVGSVAFAAFGPVASLVKRFRGRAHPPRT